MQVRRLTNIFMATTAPTNLATARAHTAGWSESFWTSLNQAGFNAPWTVQQQRRAVMLPPTAAIVGYRIQEYTISGNKLLPGGTSAGRQNLPGSGTLTIDLPQVALQANCASRLTPNSSRLVLRGMPDSIMVGGEYQPTATFQAAFTNFANSMSGLNFGFIGRDLAQASVRVLSIAGNVITVDAIPATGLVVGDFVRLNRVYGELGNPVKGSFRVTAIAGQTVTVAGLVATVTKPSGTIRRDQLTYLNYGQILPIRAVVKKVGRPFEQYRGRRSKSRV